MNFSLIRRASLNTSLRLLLLLWLTASCLALQGPQSGALQDDALNEINDTSTNSTRFNQAQVHTLAQPQHQPHHQHQSQQQQQQQQQQQDRQPTANMAPVDQLANQLEQSHNNSIATAHPHKKSQSALHQQSLNKLKRYLSERQHELVKRHSGSLFAVARAIKMTIVECQFQMRHEPWDCPIYGFSVKPVDVFGKLMTRNFKQTSFVHSLLSSAIAHSVARACTESMIITCSPSQTRDGFVENIQFGLYFAQAFMEAAHDFSETFQVTHGNQLEAEPANAAAVGATLNSPDRNLMPNNIIVTGSGAASGSAGLEAPTLMQQQLAATSGPATVPPLEPTDEIRTFINMHNAEVGRLRVLKGMRRECKCHGLSGSCNVETCWLKLPPFREVASKLYFSLDQAIRYIYQETKVKRQKSLTSAPIVRKSNKKRSSMPQPVNGLSRSSTSHHVAGVGGSTGNSLASGGGGEAAKVKRRPVARSISNSALSFTKEDLLYYEEAPDFCKPNEKFNIKGTKGRVCSESSHASNSCERLCCRRGYKTEVREERYKCECLFKFCCTLDCNTCTRRKVIHKCL